MIKALIFDYDGVIFDTVKIAWDIVKAVCDKYCKRKIKTKKEFLDIYKTNFYSAMEERGVTDSDMDKLKADSIKFLKRKHPKPFRGIKKVMNELAKKYKIAIVSSNYTDVMKHALSKAKILDDFNLVLGAEHEEHKTKKIRLCLKKFNLKPSEAVFVTDTIGDIKEAKKVKLKTMAVTWGFHKKKSLIKVKPTFIADKPSDMIKVIE